MKMSFLAIWNKNVIMRVQYKQICNYEWLNAFRIQILEHKKIPSQAPQAHNTIYLLSSKERV